MEQKVAIIVGGTGGIGIETAKALGKMGFKVCICANEDDPKLKVDYDFYNLDITDINSVQKIFSQIIDKYSRIDSIIHTASCEIKNDSLKKLEWTEFQKHIDVQIKGMFHLVNALLKIKNEHRVKFVTVLTEYCFGKPPVRVASYVSAKYGLMGLVKSMASELDPEKYTFNMVSPGMVKTPLLSNLPAKLIELTAEANPMKRIAEPKDVANVIKFLVSDEANYLNGVNIPINGGNIFS